MKIGFYGAAQMVTGSNYWVETERGTRFLVDCGLFQGGEEELYNTRPFPFDVTQLDFVLLTHAHIDHSGRLPKLVADGFRGKIYATKATAELSAVMLADSAHIQRQDAENENRKRTRQGRPLIEPLYDDKDVQHTMNLFETHRYGETFSIGEDVKICFRDAGHILGSALIELWVEEQGKTTKICFSGDLGMREHLLLNNPSYIRDADAVLMESTYGNTAHGDYESSLRKLIEVITNVTERGGSVIIPSFAVGRTQELIYELNNYYDYNDVPEEQRVPIYVDSPLANKVTDVFMKNTDCLNEEAQKKIRSGDNIFEFANLHYVTSVEDSRSLNMNRQPKVIISASGMATAGRVRHHLKHALWNKKNAVVFVGYQASGTLGRILKDGADRVKLFGEWIQVAAEMIDIPGFSAHADAPTLKDWVAHFASLERVILVHGEPEQMQPLAEELTARGLEVSMPKLGEVLEIHPNQTVRKLEEATPLPDLSQIMNSYYQVQEMLERVEDHRPDLEGMPPERLADMQRTLNEIKAGLLEWNMITGK
ncbi:MAG: MBL fold metallo-hydrolase [Ndongobacter sp.]|nr:MBL fold metallo-hydrolase [Ndongobacter sp.]